MAGGRETKIDPGLEGSLYSSLPSLTTEGGGSGLFVWTASSKDVRHVAKNSSLGIAEDSSIGRGGRDVVCANARVRRRRGARGHFCVLLEPDLNGLGHQVAW